MAKASTINKRIMAKKDISIVNRLAKKNIIVFLNKFIMMLKEF